MDSDELEKRRERNRLWYEKNKEKKRQKQKEWHESHLEHDRERNRKYQSLHRDELLSKRREWYSTNKDKLQADMRTRRANLRSEILEHYGNKCACCGETEPKFLAVDHIDGGGYKHRKKIGQDGHSLYHWIKKNNFPSDFQLLCHNCNMAKGLYGECPHNKK